MPNALLPSHPLSRELDVLVPNFTCSWTNDGLGAVWVHVAGELDMATTPELERTLRDPRAQAPLVVIDLRELAFIASAGLHAIVNATRSARRAGRRLVVLRGRPHVDRMFTLIGATAIVEIVDLAADAPPAGLLLQLAAGNTVP